ncbi:unnamed protein product [Meloidogyne enterolobii]|uniref:Uncharacterized protein n=1 Tax=Meloidogyne enterolobii TaxID=390850 RepID=A0ACB0Y7L8_MELEN
MKASIYDIRFNLGTKTKIIGYDLGGITENKEMMNELEKVCNFEWRKFNFSVLPETVRKPTVFAWKIVIIAEILNEYPTMIYADAGVRFYYDGFNNYFDRIEDGTISGLQMPSDSGHSIAFATHPDFYKYIPHYWEEMSEKSWKEMHEANFMIIHRNEYTRKLLKWAILCAYTLECIDPPGSRIVCEHPYVGIAKCHRQDQSIINILTNNLEKEILLEENERKFYSHYDDQNPRIYPNGFFNIMRRLPLRRDFNFEKAVKCN